MINIIETNEYQLTVYIHTVDDKKKNHNKSKKYF